MIMCTMLMIRYRPRKETKVSFPLFEPSAKDSNCQPVGNFKYGTPPLSRSDNTQADTTMGPHTQSEFTFVVNGEPENRKRKTVQGACERCKRRKVRMGRRSYSHIAKLT